MAFNLNVDGMEIYLNINGYEKTNSDNWDSTWCQVDFSFMFPDCINYSKSNDEVLLACEIESLENGLTNLLERLWVICYDTLSLKVNPEGSSLKGWVHFLTIAPENERILRPHIRIRCVYV